MVSLDLGVYIVCLFPFKVATGVAISVCCLDVKRIVPAFMDAYRLDDGYMNYTHLGCRLLSQIFLDSVLSK